MVLKLAPNNLGKWLRFSIIGNTLSIGVAASISLFVYLSLNYPKSFSEKTIFWMSILIAGILHGTIYGFFQHKAFPKDFRVSARQWIIVCVIASVIGWMAMISPFIFIGNPEYSYSNPRFIIHISFSNLIWIASSTGLFFGGLLGVTQSFLLRKYATNTRLWILANLLGWSIGMCAVFITATLADAYLPKVFIFIICAFGGELCGKCVGLLTFFAAERMKYKDVLE